MLQDGLKRLFLCSSDEGIDIGSGDAHGWCMVGAESWNTQFTKTDAGQFGSIIPVSADPRKHLRAGMTLPPRYAQATVERADKLYSSVKDGPTLRFVVKEDDMEAMLTQGYYAAHLRHRF